MDVATATGQALRVAVLADDLTGAGDTVVQFAQRGWPSFLQRSADVPPLPALAAVGQSLNTRALPDAEASARTRAATRVQLDAGVTRLYLKIDSTMRGSVAAQLAGALEAWRTVHAGAFVVLCPAYPAMGRTIRDGRLWVNGAALEDSPAGSDPVTPMRTSVFTELVPGAAIVEMGQADKLRAAIVSAAHDHDVVVVEASEQAALVTLAAVVAQLGAQALPAGSAGLALALADAWHPQGGSAARVAAPQGGGSTLLLRTSANAVSRRQVARLLEELPATNIAVLSPTLADLADDASAELWITRLRAASPTAGLLVLEAPVDRIAGATLVDASRRVARLMAAAVAALVARGQVRTLVLLGGDGADATLDALGVRNLHVMRNIVEGVPVAEGLAGGGQGLVVVTKAGGFGDENTLVTVVRWLRGELPEF
jgi:D-threonate/D-erythronate kinase